MGIHLTWDSDAKQGLLQYYGDTWTMTDYERMIAKTRAALHSVEHGVYIIGIVEDSFDLPEGFLHRFALLGKDTSRNLRGIIIIGDNYKLRMIYNVFSKVDHPLVRNVHFVDSLNEARWIINEHNAQEN